MQRISVPALVALGAFAVSAACGETTSTTPDEAATVDLARGAELFANNCAQCHGVDAQGTEQGPPFLHPVYEPGHHGDESFQRAAANGVQPHHWDFGPMPPIGAQNGLTREDVADIIAYVRQLQRDVGIG